MTPVVIGALILVAVLAVIVVVGRWRRRDADGVAMFQRQIDALSPEARRPVVDKLQQIDAEQDAPTGDDPKDKH